MKLRHKKIQAISLVFVITAVLYLILLVFSTREIKKVLNQDIEDHLTGISRQNKMVMAERFDNELTVLEEYASIIRISGGVTSVASKEFIEQLQSVRSDAWYILSDIDGENYVSTGNAQDVRGKEWFQRILNQETSGYKVVESVEEDGKQIIIMSVPIMGEEVVTGLLIACFDTQGRSDMATVSELVHDAQSYMLDSNGNVMFLAAAENQSLDQDAGLKFSDEDASKSSKDLASMKQDMKEGKEGVIQYSSKNQAMDTYIAYSPIGVNGWYFVDEIPSKVLQQRNKNIQLLLITVSVSTAIIFLLLVYLLFRLRKRFAVEKNEVTLQDRLTKLPNRKYLLQFYDKISKKEGQYVYLLFHVNFFNRLNRMFGYEVGSNLLKEIGGYLKTVVEDGECAGRASNDFFGLILKKGEKEAMETRVASIFKGLSEIEVMDNSVSYDYTCYYTGGICTLDDRDATLEEINNAAYKVIHDLGELEQNQFGFFEEKQKEEQELQDELANGIVRALQEKEFVPHFQPQYNIDSNEITGAEVLARWQHPQRGILMPNSFVPLLEDAGCILDLDLIMLEEACRQIKLWINEGLLPVPLSINFSMLNLHRRDFVKRVQRIVEEYGISPALISLEFKNSAVYENIEKAKVVFKELKNIGFKLTIDGFGTGDSSFRIIEEVEIRNLKLDRMFISRMDQNQKSQVLIEHLIKVSQSLGIVVIAEGVETKDQLEFLQTAGCKFAQGFLFEKPCSISEFEALIFQ